MAAHWWQTLFTIIAALDTHRIDYTLSGESALYAQHIELAGTPPITIELQWDLFHRARELFPAAQMPDETTLSFQQDGVSVTLFCRYNTVVATDPYRLQIEREGHRLWVRSAYFYAAHLPEQDPIVQAIKRYWHTLQQQNTRLNQQAWTQESYDAWVHRFGPAEAVASRLRKEPYQRLGTLAPYLVTSSPVSSSARLTDELAGKRIINLLGSHGLKATALALCGAQVTVVDISPENARYALDVARAAGVTLHYLVSDVLMMPESERQNTYDLAIMELGILHYFVDLQPLFQTVMQVLKPGGRLILQDFHPISTKLITSQGKKQKVSGNYFDPTIVETDVAFRKHLPDELQSRTGKVYQRRWTLGEIVTAAARSGLLIRQLDEEPNLKKDDIGIPKLFTLVAEHP